MLIVGVSSAVAMFGGDGRQTTDFGGFDGAYGIGIQSDQRVVAAGSADHAFAVARYSGDGELDSAFSGDGKTTTSFGESGTGALDLALQPNDKIVAVGSTNRDGTPVFAVARYAPDGELDGSFSGNGKLTTAFPGDATARGVAIQADGRIVVAGEGQGTLVLARYRVNGQLDESFSKNGRTTLDLGTGSKPAADVAIAEDGRIVVACGTTRRRNSTEYAIARFHRSGAVDRSFSRDGVATGSGGRTPAVAIAIQSNGRVVVATSNTPHFIVARLRRDGSEDRSFSGGSQDTAFGTPRVSVGDVAIQPDGRIVAVGKRGGDVPAFALARYRKGGARDHSFSGNSKLVTDFGPGDKGRGVAIQNDGKIVAAGETGIEDHDFALARYLANGSLDN